MVVYKIGAKDTGLLILARLVWHTNVLLNLVLYRLFNF